MVMLHIIILSIIGDYILPKGKNKAHATRLDEKKMMSM